MIPGTFDYLAPGTLPEAIALLQQHGEDAKILAGGHSLIPLMKLRLAQPAFLIDINKIAGLSYIKEQGGELRIGALTREAELDASDLVRTRYLLLADTARVIADPLVRNMATVGGNLAHADPANDHPATMLAYGATVVATGPSGQRVIPIAEFFTGLFATALASDEILSEIRIPTPPAHSGGAYMKLERKVGDYATAAVAAQITLDAGGVCQYAGIGLTAVDSVPVKAVRAEAALRGQPLSDEAIRAAAQTASEECDPTADLRGSADYKRAMVKVLARRALTKARVRAGV
ncbi:MAG: FAD binding domain-containing protein [Roseiflexaceae bacterium]